LISLNNILLNFIIQGRFRDSKPPPPLNLWWIAYRRIHLTGSLQVRRRR
jgi:hypothetical protein